MMSVLYQKAGLLVCLALALFINCAVAQKQNTDISDETEEVSTLKKGSLQIESAMLYNHFSDHPYALINESMIRYGLSSRLEVRLLTEQGKEKEQFIENTVQSMNAVAVGIKLAMLKSKGVLPAITLVPYLQVPVTYSKDVKAYWSPTILLAFQHELHEHWKLDYHAGVQQQAFSTEWSFPFSASLHYEVSDKLDMFTEYFSQFQPGEDPFHNLGGGLVWRAVHGLQVFISGGSSITYSPDNYFFKLGIGWMAR